MDMLAPSVSAKWVEGKTKVQSWHGICRATEGKAFFFGKKSKKLFDVLSRTSMEAGAFWLARGDDTWPISRRWRGIMG